MNARPEMHDAAKHDRSEPPTPQPDGGLATGPGIYLDCHPTESGDAPCVIDLPEITLVDEKTVDDAPGCEKNDDALKESSEHDLLQQLSASAIESCRGTDFAEPRWYLHVFGFKSPEMETMYVACHARTSLTGHKLFAGVNAIYLLLRILTLLQGNNYVEASMLTTYFFCTLGVVAVLSASCGVYFSGQEVKHRQALARASIIIAATAISGWIAQFLDVFHFQTDWDDEVVAVFHMGYFVGALCSLGPAFCLVMLRVAFHWCAAAHLSIGVLIISASYSSKAHMATFLALPLLQVGRMS